VNPEREARLARAQAAADVPVENQVKITGSGSNRMGELGGKQIPIPADVADADAVKYVVETHADMAEKEMRARKGAR